MYKLTIIAFIATAFSANAQGYQVNLQGQKQQGMGGAGAALPLDAAAVFFNPASISFLKNSSINLGFTPTFANTLYTDKASNETGRTNSPMGTPFSAYGVYRKSEESMFYFGLGVYTPFGSTVQYEDEWIGRFALTRLQLKNIFIQPTMSFKMSDKVSIGAGFVYSTGSVNLQKDIPVQFSDGTYGSAELSGKAQGFGYNVGFYMNATEKISVGITYRSQVNMAVKDGKAEFTVPQSLASNFPNGSFTSSLPLPQVLTIAGGYKVNNQLALALDVNYVSWSAYDTLSFDYEQNTASLVDTRSAREYKNTFSFRLGGEYKITEQLQARLGFAYCLTPVQDGYVTPETPDANRINYTLGLGYLFGEHFGVDASLLFTHLERTDRNLETNLEGTYKTNVLAPGISVYYQF